MLLPRHRRRAHEIAAGAYLASGGNKEEAMRLAQIEIDREMKGIFISIALAVIVSLVADLIARWIKDRLLTPPEFVEHEDYI